MNFQYTKHMVEPSPTISEGVVYRPEVVLRVAGKNSDLYLAALVDTGADETILPLSVAAEIGVDLDTDRMSLAGGVSGQHIELVPGKVELELLGTPDRYRWSSVISFARFDSPDDECAILGHAGALQYFTATFDGKRHRGSLVPNRTFPAGAS
jgi:hypothetical protein